MTDLHLPVSAWDLADLLHPRCSDEVRSCAQLATAKRLVRRGDELVSILDSLSDDGIACCFIRFTPTLSGDATFRLNGNYGVVRCPGGGWLLLPSEDEQSGAYWAPQLPKARRLDSDGHVLDERAVDVGDIVLSATEAVGRFHIPSGWSLDWVVWRFPPSAASVVDELRYNALIETHSHFLWSSHTAYRCPADVFAHLIHGRVYETVTRWPKRWKIFSENDAHALYVVLSGLERATGKRLYRLLKHQLLISVLDRQANDGAWRHGEWTDNMECHYRLHCSAMHMLMDAHAERPEPVIRSALERAAAFIAKQTDSLNSGVWFLHDELEHSRERMRDGPFRWLPSRALGKSETNMLVLNTHLDATVALDRYRELTGDSRHQELLDQAESSVHAVLALRSAEWLYSVLFKAIRLTFLPSNEAARLPLGKRAVKRLAWKYLVRLLPHIKALFPRIVMPGGYIDRELSLQAFTHAYLPINLMDLLRFRRRFPNQPNDEIVDAGLDLIAECRMYERWPEIGKAYAVAFWAEALYQACLTYRGSHYRGQLAHAVRELERTGIGLPPSLLGCNGEAVEAAASTPTLLVDDPRIRVVNLCALPHVEFLIVNCANAAVPLRISRNMPDGLSWTLGPGPQLIAALPDEVPARAWLWGRRPA